MNKTRAKIKKIVSNNEPFCTVPNKLMKAAFSLWQDVLDECENESNNHPPKGNDQAADKR